MCLSAVMSVLSSVMCSGAAPCSQQGRDPCGQVKGGTWRVAGHEESSQHHEKYQHSWCLWRGSKLLPAPMSLVASAAEAS